MVVSKSPDPSVMVILSPTAVGAFITLSAEITHSPAATGQRPSTSVNWLSVVAALSAASASACVLTWANAFAAPAAGSVTSSFSMSASSKSVEGVTCAPSPPSPSSSAPPVTPSEPLAPCAPATPYGSECTLIAYCSPLIVAITSVSSAPITWSTPSTAASASRSSAESPSVDTTRMSMSCVAS